MSTWNRLRKSKTFWTSIAGLVGTAGAYSTGEMEPQNAIMTAVGCLIAIFFRDAIAKSEPNDPRPDREGMKEIPGA